MEGNYPRMLLVTANVGSIFEDPDHMLKIWLREFLKSVQHYQPGLLALHCQEVGGKNYEDSMQHVNKFVKAMLGCEELQKYDRARVFLDEDFTAADKFTALGNLYFVHESVEDISIWDFVDCKFIPVVGREVLSGNIETVQIKEKAKFPQDFFPDFKWSRKGFIRTRWNIKNCIFDLVNIHLFHDASNIISMQDSPSVYSKNRKAAFIHTLKRFEEDQYDKVPQFIFGDFNFRLDSNALINELTKKTTSNQTKGKKGQVNKICYTEEVNNKVVLTLETKGFDCHEKHSEIFLKKSKHLRKYDNEMLLYKDRLFEYEINFPPRIKLYDSICGQFTFFNMLRETIRQHCQNYGTDVFIYQCVCSLFTMNETVVPKYDTIGKDSCMGDHKNTAIKNKKKTKNDAYSSKFNSMMWKCSLYRKVMTSRYDKKLFLWTGVLLELTRKVSPIDNSAAAYSRIFFIFTPTVSAPELLQLPTATEVIIPSTQVKISHVDTTKYIHIRQQNGKSTRVFRETSV
ncbi:inositol-1,4,5-trisphosphate 5-phosphatase [Mytilus galloprovincialis]|uniref:inositol-polyphosphate 5-phosphatase n=1 Tax=Mytilus galloprovincialis TaxID=29158 RepID=A0A8B6CRK3_MYTGA|nr:inositol-1,4,5-trisphosphate 5-phosphatase [Mytilus galloprovincialis]